VRLSKPNFSRVFNKDFMTRFAMVFIVVLFLITTVGVSVYGFIESNKKSKEDSTQTTPPPTPPANNNKSEGKKMQNFTPVSKVDSLQKTDLKEGTGAEATASSNVTVHYTGAVAATGTIFQSSLDTGKPVSFALNQVIKGWSEGVPGMKVGGERRLLIPADMAYGANPPQGANIPPNADLVFDITLLNVK
jgi:FKBP-type peptidyl-prolyl cis-trans isomerase